MRFRADKIQRMPYISYYIHLMTDKYNLFYCNEMQILNVFKDIISQGGRYQR